MKVGAYEVEDELGRGGMGVVHRARSADGRLVALKMTFAAPDALTLERFEREARLLASFSEADGFVPILDRGSHEGRAWFTMPLLPGGTLRTRLERASLPVAVTVALVHSLAVALGRAHERGVVHRDVKPENVLFTHRGAEDGDWGRPLLADLGLAKHFRVDVLGASRTEQLTGTGAIAGTAGYVAPEQLEDARRVGPATDVFALGAVLYEALAGRRAFPNDGVMSYVKVLKAGPPPPIARAAVSKELAAVAMKALRLEPAERHADGHAFARALLAATEDGTRAASRVRRIAVPLLALGSTFAVVAAVALAARRVTPPAPDPAPPRLPPPAPPAVVTSAVRSTLSAADLVARATARRLRRDLEGALADYSAAMELCPPDHQLLCFRGATHLEVRDVDSAIHDFTRAIELAPHYPAGWFGRGLARMAASDWAPAAADFELSVVLQPDDPTSWLMLADTCSRCEQMPRALEAATRLLALAPEKREHWSVRARVRYRLGDFDGAVADCTRAIEIDPRSASDWANRALAWHDLRDHARCLEDTTRAIELDPKPGKVWALRAKAYAVLGDRARAIADYKQALERDETMRDEIEDSIRNLEAGR